jgi:ABC-type multidrug transport system fused ATPase/permease subunit
MEEKKQKRKYSTFQVIGRQLRLISEHKMNYLHVIFVLNMFCSGLLPFIAIFIPRIVIDSLTQGLSKEVIIRSIVLVCALSLVLSIMRTFFDNIRRSRFIELRTKEFFKINSRYLDIDYPFLEDASFRDRVETAQHALSNNVDGFEGAYHNLFEILPLLFSVILYSVLIGIFQPLIFVACIIGAFVSILVNRAITKYVIKRKDDVARTRRRKNYFYNTCYDFAYGKDIRIYQLQDKLSADYKQRSYNYITVMKEIANKRFAIGLLELIMLLLQDGLAYYFVIKGYFAGAISLGEVSLYIGAIIALSTALRSISTNITNLNTNTQLTSDYFEIMDDDSYVSLQGNRTALPKGETLEIEFRNVSFKYPRTERFILKDFNFKIHKGEKLAIVGANGAGKSTIVKLISGLFMPTSGEILLNGINIREFAQEEYFKMFSVVFQEVHIYASSIIRNVIGTDEGEEAYARGKLCLERVGLKEKIESLPQGYETQLLKVIDEEGVEFSGGQNQKIAIARALYKDANMVILDEPTAALDALAEAEIYQSFDDLVREKTAVYISHRLSSTKFCDKIALFSADGLLEYGTHEELMAQEGEYYKMFITQGKYYQNGVNEDA